MTSVLTPSHITYCPVCNMPLRNDKLSEHEHRTDYTFARYEHPIDTSTNKRITNLYDVYPANDRTHIFATIEFIPYNHITHLAAHWKTVYPTPDGTYTQFANNLADALHQLERTSLTTSDNLLINNWA